MTIGLICAIPQELHHLRSQLTEVRTQRIAHTEFDEGVLDGHRVVLSGSGMGKVNSAITATLLLSTFGCDSIVMSGVAGGLDPSLEIGDVVIADRVIQSDVGMIKNERLEIYQPGHAALIDPTERLGFSPSVDVLTRVKSALEQFCLPPLPPSFGGPDRPPRITYGTVLTGDQYLHCENTRQRLHRQFDGAAIEMEGGSIAQVAEAFGAPWLVIRALSDLAGDGAFARFTEFAESVATSSAAIVRKVLPAFESPKDVQTA